MNFAGTVPSGIAGVDLELVTTDVGDLWFPLIDEVMRDHVRSAGTWEPEIGEFLRGAFPREGGVFIDIGANVGYFSALVADAFPSATIHAFEPHPITSKILRLNTWKHKERVHVWPCALGDHRGTVALNTTKNNLGDTRGVDPSDRLVTSSVAPVATLDEILCDTSADLIKIDVQGAELLVMAGMRLLVNRSPGLKIVLEFSPGLLEMSHVNPVAALAALREQGFDIGLIHPDGLVLAGDREILSFCQSAGPLGQANIVLYSRN
ncbi:FkbM family methyltransferase [Rhodanobacter sp. 115]|uniref:FkbM family methyltransferase n=1 Tax=Rhodanobacter sp. FW021-MT20 TaxID=1162282 RepID=UPI001ED91989|nr:FkbM family methyltransferase [Rhodanobacter sp. 115]